MLQAWLGPQQFPGVVIFLLLSYEEEWESINGLCCDRSWSLQPLFHASCSSSYLASLQVVQHFSDFLIFTDWRRSLEVLRKYPEVTAFSSLGSGNYLALNFCHFESHDSSLLIFSDPWHQIWASGLLLRSSLKLHFTYISTFMSVYSPSLYFLLPTIPSFTACPLVFGFPLMFYLPMRILFPEFQLGFLSSHRSLAET